MLTVAQREYLVLAILALIFVVALIPSLLTSRALVRDGLRKQDITYLKRSLENYYNQRNIYPPIPVDCITTGQPAAWTFVTALPHDIREQPGFVYRYCATSATPLGTTGYFLEAQFESYAPDTRAFDEDEQRKFHFRILHEDGKTLYRVCGGEEMQCKPIINE
ncbi:MAG: hypothetical protein HY372_02210 [Candidatus Andersenbacteria bacterium]|nr:hypothetical protein [Candidatus Andersenbacteria bacterium]